MKIDVRFHGVPSSENLRHHTLRRTREQLARFGHEITQVVVRIRDVNGPRGGLDKTCHIRVQGPRIGTSTVEKVGVDPMAALNLAAHKMVSVAKKRLERRRVTRPRKPIPAVEF